MKYLPPEASLFEKRGILTDFGQTKMKEEMKNSAYKTTEKVREKAGKNHWLISFDRFNVNTVGQ